MEIYKEIETTASKEFVKLLNSQLSKNKIEEGKIVEGKVAKITEKFVFLFIEGLKSEPVLDINEIKTIKLYENVKVGDKVSVLLERIEDRNGEVVVSASKAQKIKGWFELEKAYDKNEPIMGKITSKCKGGVIVEHIETGSLMFCPGSQISDKPLKDISHLINEPQKFALIKLDKIRGNACVSRRQIISSNKQESKKAIVEKYISSKFDFAFGQHSGLIDINKNKYELPRFPINEKYGDLKRFSFLLNLSPLEYKNITPKDKYILQNNNPPKTIIEFFKKQKNLDKINCFSNEGNKWDKSKINLIENKLYIEFRDKFSFRRGRVNCSLNDDIGWRWLGIQFSIEQN